MKHGVSWPVIPFALVLLLANGCSKDTKEVLAEGSGVKILAQDFKVRYQAFLESGGKRDNIVARKEILTNMVNEQLIYKNMTQLGLDSDGEAKREFEEIRHQALLDAYARDISTDSMAISEAELMEEFRTRNSKVSARYLYAKSQSEAVELKRKLEAGATFESLARGVFEDPGLANNGGYLGYFSGGEMEPALEEVAFSQPIGSVSDPVKLKVGYAIIRVEDRVRNPMTSESDYAQMKPELERSIGYKKAIRYMRKATEEISSTLQPKFNEQSVSAIISHWNYVTDSVMSSGESPMSVPDDISGSELVRFTAGTWTVGEFLRRADATMKRQRKRVKDAEDLKDFVLGLATREVLLKRAEDANLMDNEMVQSQIKKNSQAYLLKRWRSVVQDTVGQHGWNDAELRMRFEQNRQRYQFPPEVNVAEILVRTKPEADRLLRAAKKGADFATLASKNSIRLWAAKRGGELGFGTKAVYGILGEKFFAASVGAVLGPEFVDPYYGVFKILERREGRPKTYDEAKPDIINEISFERKQEVFKNAIVTLGTLSPENMNLDAVANVVLEKSR